jgi:peptidoglycan/LPS O-acetylase OafA/YrhL
MHLKGNHLIELDILRASAACLIVICHLQYYTKLGSYQSTLEFASGFIALSGLSLFFFVSGFVIEKNYRKITLSDELYLFYKKRIFRLYPLFIIALIAWSIHAHLIKGSPLNDIIYKFAISMVTFLGIDGSYGWFVGVILIYYFIFPLITIQECVPRILFLSLIILIPFAVLHYWLNLIWANFFIFYSTFIFGIIVSKYNIPTKYRVRILLFFLIISIIGLIFYFHSPLLKRSLILPWISAAISPFGALLAYLMAREYYRIIPANCLVILLNISFCSYAIYLFHGVILSLISINLIRINVSGMYYNILLLSIGMPTIFFICNALQRCEQSLINKIENK